MSYQRGKASAKEHCVIKMKYHLILFYVWKNKLKNDTAGVIKKLKYNLTDGR